jgi:NhaA family Na+:H+ antiporter
MPVPSQRRRGPISTFRTLLVGQAGGGLVLMAAALAGLVIANSAAAPGYFAVLKYYVAGHSILHWINDGLMTLFFLLVGLEIKRELQGGQLSTWSRRVLPGIAGLAGMAAPVLIYVALNAGNAETMDGWAIPTATDIAFALGVLALFGSRIPVSLKIFLTALAILDDLLAVIIIAAFYTEDLALGWLGLAGVMILVLMGLNRAGVMRLAPYLVLGAVLWFFVAESGVHPTLAGVALAAAIPLRPHCGLAEEKDSPLHVLEHAIHPWVSYLVVPLFGLANAGVSFAGMTWATLVEPVTIGVALGLFLGKQAVFLATWIAVKLRLARCPAEATWLQVYGVALLCGIGFTVSLFIGLLAFPDALALQDEAKVGVLIGSLLSGVSGVLVLVLAPPKATAA